MIIELPYPDMALMPNRKNGKHWTSTKIRKQTAVNSSFVLTKQASIGKKFLPKPIAMMVTFIQNDKRHRDLDNLLAAIKPNIDGVARALGVDDKLFEPITIKRGYCKSQSATILELTQ